MKTQNKSIFSFVSLCLGGKLGCLRQRLLSSPLERGAGGVLRQTYTPLYPLFLEGKLCVCLKFLCNKNYIKDSEMIEENKEKVLILDFGSQYAQLIARRVRENNVFSEIVSHKTPAKQIQEINPKGIILSGGPASVYVRNAPRCDEDIAALGIPILGISTGCNWDVRCWELPCSPQLHGNTEGRHVLSTTPANYSNQLPKTLPFG